MTEGIYIVVTKTRLGIIDASVRFFWESPNLLEACFDEPGDFQRMSDEVETRWFDAADYLDKIF